MYSAGAGADGLELPADLVAGAAYGRAVFLREAAAELDDRDPEQVALKRTVLGLCEALEAITPEGVTPEVRAFIEACDLLMRELRVATGILERERAAHPPDGGPSLYELVRCELWRQEVERRRMASLSAPSRRRPMARPQGARPRVQQGRVVRLRSPARRAAGCTSSEDRGDPDPPPRRSRPRRRRP
jgi:hypothetical protein